MKAPIYTREYVLKQFWQSSVDDRFDLETAIQTKAEFSCVIAVMAKTGGWEEKKLGGIEVHGKHVDIHEICC